jgi:hypothetical protein
MVLPVDSRERFLVGAALPLDRVGFRSFTGVASIGAPGTILVNKSVAGEVGLRTVHAVNVSTSIFETWQWGCLHCETKWLNKADGHDSGHRWA